MTVKVSEIDAQLDAVAERVRRDRATLVTAKANITSAEADLASIPTAYADLISTINTEAANNPDDAYWQTTKARKDKLASEFTTLKTTATSMKTNLTNNDPSA